jgi:hypothetical protein
VDNNKIDAWLELFTADSGERHKYAGFAQRSM